LPRHNPKAPKDKAEDSDSEDSDCEPSSIKTKGLFVNLTSRLKKSFCFKEDLEDKMYKAHIYNKKIRQRRKAMLIHMGLPVSDGSENTITPPEEWKSKHKWMSSEESIPENTVRPSQAPHGKGHVQEDDEDDEDEEDDEEEDDEDDDDEDDEDEKDDDEDEE
jgi:hypothetical protein